VKTEELPPGWALASGHELFAFVTSGSRGWADFYTDTGPVFVRIGNLDHHTIALDLRETQRVQPPTGAEGTRTRTRPDDILISITADVGMVGLVRPSLGEAYINQHIALARPVPGLNAAYLAWFLTSPRGKLQLRSMERGATKKGLGLDDIRAVKLPIAPLPEQERIVGEIEKQLTRLDSGVAALKRAQAQLKRYRASVLKAACEGRLVSTEAELARREKRDYEPADKLLARILKERRARWEADQLAKMKAAGKLPKEAGKNNFSTFHCGTNEPGGKWRG
jgi:type I restriction enzyme S subunit